MPLPDKIQKVLDENNRRSLDAKRISEYIPMHPEWLKGIPIYLPHEIDLLAEMIREHNTKIFFRTVPEFHSCMELFRWLDQENNFSVQNVICGLLTDKLEDMPLSITSSTSDLVTVFAAWRLKIGK